MYQYNRIPDKLFMYKALVACFRDFFYLGVRNRLLFVLRTFSKKIRIDSLKFLKKIFLKTLILMAIARPDMENGILISQVTRTETSEHGEAIVFRSFRVHFIQRDENE